MTPVALLAPLYCLLLDGDLQIHYLDGAPKYQNGEKKRFQVEDSETGKVVPIADLTFHFSPPGWGEVTAEPDNPRIGVLKVLDARIDPLRGASFRISCEYTLKKSGGTGERVAPQLAVRPGNLLIELSVFSSVIEGQPLDAASYGVEWHVEGADCSVERVQGQYWLYVPASELDKTVSVRARFSSGEETAGLVLCPRYYCSAETPASDSPARAVDAAAPVTWTGIELEMAGTPLQYTKRLEDADQRIRDNTSAIDEYWELLRDGNALVLRGERRSDVEVSGVDRGTIEWSEEGTESFALTKCSGELADETYRLEWSGRLSYDARRTEGPVGRRGEKAIKKLIYYRGSMVLRESSSGVLSGTFVIDQSREGEDADWKDLADKTERPIRFRIRK